MLHYISLCAPMFLIVGLGYGLMRVWRHGQAVHDKLSHFVFAIALPALLFGMMSDLSRLPPVDLRVLLAFFGSCLLVFVVARVIGRTMFQLDGVSQSLFALAGIFSNNALLGLPLAHATLGEAAIPTVALVLVFNSLILWTLVTVSVEWARHGALSVAGFGATVKGVLSNPLILAILSGTLVGLNGWRLPALVMMPVGWLGMVAAPLALFTLGMGLATYGIRQHWRAGGAMCGIKLLLQPLIVWLLARALGLPQMETRAVVLLGSVSVGANVYLMSRHFKVMEGPVAASLVLSTAGAALSTPLILALTA